MFDMAAIAADPQKAVHDTATLKVIVELLLDTTRQGWALHR
jgi:hypothetical protein